MYLIAPFPDLCLLVLFFIQYEVEFFSAANVIHCHKIIPLTVDSFIFDVMLGPIRHCVGPRDNQSNCLSVRFPKIQIEYGTSKDMN